jgi:hypothetical protein
MNVSEHPALPTPVERALRKRILPKSTSFDIHATGMPILDAQADFRRARRAYLVARLAGWASWHAHSPTRLRSLSEHDFLPGGPRRMQVVPLASIVGTVNPTTEFDGRFRPASKRLQRRWERIALAQRKGTALRRLTCATGPTGTKSSTAATGCRLLEVLATATSTPG